jgi:hypothetical protein
MTAAQVDIRLTISNVGERAPSGVFSAWSLCVDRQNQVFDPMTLEGSRVVV